MKNGDYSWFVKIILVLFSVQTYLSGSFSKCTFVSIYIVYLYFGLFLPGSDTMI